MGAIGGSIPGIVVLGNDEQGFVGNTREDGSGRIRSRAKIEATASDGAENASDHFVTSFLVFGYRKGGASFRSSAYEKLLILALFDLGHKSLNTRNNLIEN